MNFALDWISCFTRQFFIVKNITVSTNVDYRKCNNRFGILYTALNSFNYIGTLILKTLAIIDNLVSIIKSKP